MDVNDVTSKSNPAEPHKFATLMNLILVIAIGILVNMLFEMYLSKPFQLLYITCIYCKFQL